MSAPGDGAPGGLGPLPGAEAVPPGSLTAIAAVGRNGAIGDGHDIPWRIPEDWRRFKAVTMGGVLVVGRRTHEGMGLLGGRHSIVLTRDPGYEAPGAEVAHSLDEALDRLHAHTGRRWWVAGGGEVYRQLWPHLTHLDVTEVDQAPDVATRFPVIDPTEWVETSRHPRGGWAYVTYRRR